MKKNVLKFTGRSFLTAIFFGFISGPAFSHAGSQLLVMKKIINNNRMQIHLLKADDEKILLNIKLQNPQGSSFTLFITDENDNELFSKEYNKGELDMNITLVRFDNINSYKIGIRSSNRQLEQDYSIVPTIKYIPDVVIKKQ